MSLALDSVAQLEVLKGALDVCYLDITAILNLSLCGEIKIGSDKPFEPPVVDDDDVICIKPSDDDDGNGEEGEEEECKFGCGGGGGPNRPRDRRHCVNDSVLSIDLCLLLDLGLITEADLKAYLSLDVDVDLQGLVEVDVNRRLAKREPILGGLLGGSDKKKIKDICGVKRNFKRRCGKKVKKDKCKTATAKNEKECVAKCVAQAADISLLAAANVGELLDVTACLAITFDAVKQVDNCMMVTDGDDFLEPSSLLSALVKADVDI